MSVIFLLLVLLLSAIGLQLTVVQSIGVCYGINGNNLPSKQEVVDLYKSNGIGRMRIYYPDEQAIQTLKGSNIELLLDVDKETIQSLTDSEAATNWVNKYVSPYSPDVTFRYINVGNNIRPSDTEAQYILPAMQNIQKAISAINLQRQIKVSTAIPTTLIDLYNPPNNSAFNSDASPYINPIISFLLNNEAPLLANVFPYKLYVNNQDSIPLEYALFSTQEATNDVGYQNLFDVMLDSVYFALEKIGAPDLQIVVSDSGWPSEGGVGASGENAGAYYQNLINHVNRNGTPKKPNGPIETYLFAMFDENLKQGLETERHFGLFRPDKSPKYQLSFN